MLSQLFSNDYLGEEVRVEQPERFVIQGNENKVFKLKKASDGLKQAPIACHEILHIYLYENMFQRSENEPTLYIKKKENNILSIYIYVNDIITLVHLNNSLISSNYQ